MLRLLLYNGQPYIMSGLQSAILAMTDKRRSLFENEYILVYLVRRCVYSFQL